MKPVVLVTGGTGFVGRYVVRELLNREIDVRVYARSADRFGSAHFEGRVEFYQGDILDENRFKEAIEGCTGVVNLVGIIEENQRRNITFESVHTLGTGIVARAALEAGVETFIHMSANGAQKGGVSRYQTTKWVAEEIVRDTGFGKWSIFRPSLVFGKPESGQPEFCSQLIRTLIRPFPVWPVFGSGKYTFSPVYVNDLAQAITSSVISPPASNRTYFAAGPQTISYLELLNILGRTVGIKPRLKVHQPLWFSRTLVGVLSPTGLLPISPDQLEMLVEGNSCDPSQFVEEFGIEQTPFTEETLSYLNDV